MSIRARGEAATAATFFVGAGWPAAGSGSVEGGVRVRLLDAVSVGSAQSV
jgi:hypothetical protein